MEDKLKELEKRLRQDALTEADGMKDGTQTYEERKQSEGFINGLKVALFEIQNIDKPYFK